MTLHRRNSLAYAAIFAVLTLFVWYANPQTTHPVAKPDSPKIGADLSAKPPVLSEALLHKFFKVQSEATIASDQAKQSAQDAQQKQVAFQAVVQELTVACGKDFQPQMNKTGDPECAVKPVPAKESEKSAEPKKP